jgi:hypothetical protein
MGFGPTKVNEALSSDGIRPLERASVEVESLLEKAKASLRSSVIRPAILTP